MDRLARDGLATIARPAASLGVTPPKSPPRHILATSPHPAPSTGVGSERRVPSNRTRRSCFCTNGAACQMLGTHVYNPQCIDGFSAKLDGRRSVWRQVCQTCAQSGPSTAFHTSGIRARPGPGCRSLPMEESAGSPRQLRRRRLPARPRGRCGGDVACRTSPGARVSRWNAAPMEAWPPLPFPGTRPAGAIRGVYALGRLRPPGQVSPKR